MAILGSVTPFHHGEHGESVGCSVLLWQKFFAAWKEFFPEFSWDRTPLACMWWPLDCCCTLEACAPRNPGLLRVSAVNFLVAAGLRRVFSVNSPCTPCLRGGALQSRDHVFHSFSYSGMASINRCFLNCTLR